MNRANMEKGISDIVGVFTDPILVFPGGWGDTLPEWLKGAITMERLEMNMKVLKGEEMTGTDAEACAYLYTATLTAPMDREWGQIYLYIATRTYKRWGKNEIPADIAVDSISIYPLGIDRHVFLPDDNRSTFLILQCINEMRYGWPAIYLRLWELVYAGD